MSELGELRAKLKKRQGRPGFKANAALLERVVGLLEEGGPFHHPDTGRFVSKAFILANPEAMTAEES